jgi:hypothetical protein
MEYIGFWKEKFEKEENIMPWEINWLLVPIENSAIIDQSYYITKIKQLEKRASIREYYGSSICRICHCENGCEEYTLGNYCWPSGYVHYLEKHNVAIDPDFQLFIIRNDD